MIAAAALGVLVVLIVATNGAVLGWLAARLIDVWLVAPLPMTLLALIPVLLVATCLLSLGAHTPLRSGLVGADVDDDRAELVVHVVHHHVIEHVVHARIDVVGRTTTPAAPRPALGQGRAALYGPPPLVVPGQVIAPAARRRRPRTRVVCESAARHRCAVVP